MLASSLNSEISTLEVEAIYYIRTNYIIIYIKLIKGIFIFLLSLSRTTTAAIKCPSTDTPGESVVRITRNDSLDCSKVLSSMIRTGISSVSKEWLSETVWGETAM